MPETTARTSRAAKVTRVLGAVRLGRAKSACETAGWQVRVFPGSAEQVARAREFLAGVLDGWQASEDAILCLSELASNAV